LRTDGCSAAKGQNQEQGDKKTASHFSICFGETMGNSDFLYVRNCVVQLGERLNEYVAELTVFGFKQQVEIGD
jgi:hypothetical protein